MPRGRPPPALGSARKVTEVRCDENMQARTGGNTREGLHVISLGCIGERHPHSIELQTQNGDVEISSDISSFTDF